MEQARVDYLGFVIEVHEQDGRHRARVSHPDGKAFSAKGAREADACLVSVAETVFLPSEHEAITEAKIIAERAKLPD